MKISISRPIQAPALFLSPWDSKAEFEFIRKKRHLYQTYQNRMNLKVSMKKANLDNQRHNYRSLDYVSNNENDVGPKVA